MCPLLMTFQVQDSKIELSAANKCDDFQPIALAEDCVAMLTARHHFEIQLHCYVRLRNAQRAQERGDGAAGGDFARFTVDLNFHSFNRYCAGAGTGTVRAASSRTNAVRNARTSSGWNSPYWTLPAACAVEFQGIVYAATWPVEASAT